MGSVICWVHGLTFKPSISTFNEMIVTQGNFGCSELLIHLSGHPNHRYYQIECGLFILGVGTWVFQIMYVY